MHFLKEGQKIRAWVDPPPLFGQCPKENVFFQLTPSLTQKDGRPPPSPATIHLLPSPDLAQQTSGEEDQRGRRENKPSQVEDKPTPSSIPRRRSPGRDRLALRKRRRRTRPGMLAALQRFSPSRLMRKAKMMLRSVQSE